jgi:hypothetical protein
MQMKRIFLLAIAAIVTTQTSGLAQTISSFSPVAGPVGTDIAILGTGYAGVKPRIWFNGVEAPPSSVRVASNTRVQVYVPSGATSGRISLRTTGSQVFTAYDFVVGNGPNVISFTPNTGGPAGGDPVSISGGQFFAPITVHFNGKNSAGAVPNGSANLIQATTPGGVTTGPITVTTTGGSFTTANLFYIPPVISSFAPVSGPVGTQVIIYGTNFLGTSVVKFSGVNAAFTVSNNNQIVTSVPVGATSDIIEVVGIAGVYLTSSQFLVSPIITGFAPNVGAPGTSVTIVGRNFLGNTSVRFNGVVAGLGSVSSNQITAIVPNGATTGPISVTTTNGSTTSTNLFYLPPVVSNFSPSNSPPGSTVTVTGLNFQDASAVRFNGQSALTFSVVASNELTAVVPNGVTTGPISVTGPAGTGTSTKLFYAMPIITGFLPDKGLPGTNVTVFGSNFQGTTAVRFNGTNATFSNVTSNQLTAVVPVGAGTGPISVTAPAGTAVSAQNFVFDFMSDVRITSFTDSPDPVIIGGNLTFTIRPANSGPTTATNTIVSVTLSPGVALKSATTTLGSVNTNANPVVFILGNLNTGVQPTLTLMVTPQVQGQIFNTAVIDSDMTDPNAANNSLQIFTTVQPVPLLTILQIPPDKVRLSWSSSLTNSVLQRNSDPAQTGGWSNAPGTPTVIGNQRVLTNTIGASNQFYRLRN